MVFVAFALQSRYHHLGSCVTWGVSTDESANFSVDCRSTYRSLYWLSFAQVSVAGGAGSEVWNRVYMIAAVKKLGRVRLSTNFAWQQIWRRMQTWKDDDFLLSFKFSRVQISRKGFYDLFNGPFGHQKAWCMNSSWVTSLIVIRDLGKFSYFQASWIFERPSCSISYIFPLTVVLRLSSLS